jgi:hypothetical protein
MQAANEARATNARYGKEEGNPVADAAIHELADFRAQTAESKLEEIYQTCVRCRQNLCTALWDDMRVCEECCRILTEKYDRVPQPARGDYTNGYNAGRVSAFLEAERVLTNARLAARRGE